MRRPPIPIVVLLISVMLSIPGAGPGSNGPGFDRSKVRLAEVPRVLDPLIADLQERTFRYFWDTANPSNGLIPDRYPTPSYSSIAAVGFGLTTYPIGVERGYITREQARQRALVTLRVFSSAPQRPGSAGAAGQRGVF